MKDGQRFNFNVMAEKHAERLLETAKAEMRYGLLCIEENRPEKVEKVINTWRNCLKQPDLIGGKGSRTTLTHLQRWGLIEDLYEGPILTISEENFKKAKEYYFEE